MKKAIFILCLLSAPARAATGHIFADVISPDNPVYFAGTENHFVIIDTGD